MDNDGWITCSSMSFVTVLQSYQDDGWVIKKGCVQLNLFYDIKGSLPKAQPKQDFFWTGSV